ncbi:uncharacterized protein LOC142327975 [Lycorma delicatula]|uniref:uncharacterized protein LOC142327975 n=1 Tax=Lycorma delicatula TaxID=130591 RepID=UPI003F5134B4
MSNTEKFLVEWIFPKALESGCFGENASIESFIIDKSRQVETHFGSEVIFVELNIKEACKNEIKNYDLVIKVEIQNETFRNIVNATMQFENEILMYDTLLPMLDRNGIVEDIFCKYYYGYVDQDNPKKDFIILEDLKKKGYRLSTEKVFLDYEHCSLAMKQLGKFHALSYMKKQYGLSELLPITEKIQDKWTKESLSNFQLMFLLCAKRGIQPLIDRGESVELLKSLLNEYNDILELYGNLVRPVEPEAVLCHGDFNRNNILFKYDEYHHPTGLKLIDLQLPRYSSPVIDLSFFLLMNTTHTLRKEHLNDLLDIYKKSLLSTASNNCIVPELDFGRVAIYGYIHCSFFLPMMMADSLSETLLEDSHRMAILNSERGGVIETEALVNIIKDLLQFGYIRNSYKQIH